MLFGIIFTACKNEGLENPTGEGALKASKIDKVKIGEPVTINNDKLAKASDVLWSVTPAGSSKIFKKSNDSIVVSFTKAGKYNINAQSSIGNYSVSVNIQDSVYTTKTPSKETISPLTNDQITIKPSVIYSDSITGLLLEATTTNTYDYFDYLDNPLLYESSHTNNIFNYTFTGTKQPCYPSSVDTPRGKSVAVTYMYLAPLVEGSQAIKITLNQTVYSGSVQKSGNLYTFTWLYNSGVIISPLSVSK